MIRVFLADDHPVVRSGLRQAIDEEHDMRVVAEASDGWEVLRCEVEWDVLVLDLSLPLLSGVEVLRRLHAARPTAKVVVLSMYPAEQFARQVMHEGASAYLPKSVRTEKVLTVLRLVAQGSIYRDPEEAPAHGVGGPAHDRLTSREHQVFILLFQGRSVSEIAAELNVSVSTVSNHTARIKEKLGVRTISEVVSYAHRAGLT